MVRKSGWNRQLCFHIMSFLQNCQRRYTCAKVLNFIYLGIFLSLLQAFVRNYNSSFFNLLDPWSSSWVDSFLCFVHFNQLLSLRYIVLKCSMRAFESRVQAVHIWERESSVVVHALRASIWLEWLQVWNFWCSVQEFLVTFHSDKSLGGEVGLLGASNKIVFSNHKWFAGTYLQHLRLLIGQSFWSLFSFKHAFTFTR